MDHRSFGLARLFSLSCLVIGVAAAAATTSPARADDVYAVLANGKIRYVAPAASSASVGSRLIAKPSLSVSAPAALQKYAVHFGIKEPATELQQLSQRRLGANGDVLRYRQLHRGLPVVGADLVMTLDGAGQLRSLSGETSSGLAIPTTTPSISARNAQFIAATLVSKHHAVAITSLSASAPELSVYDPLLIGAQVPGETRLVWRVDVASVATRPIREFVLIDATSGALALNFNRVDATRRRETYTAGFTSAQLATHLCGEDLPNCTSGSNLDADLAHRYAGDTYDFYFTHHGRDSFDGAGGWLLSTVEWSDGVTCPNAFWDGLSMTYCPGASRADDVVAHELTHAVTEHTSNLLYFYQSGAINESLSDAWGEFVDLTNSSGTDTPAVRWQIGEDFTGTGTLRDMANPASFSDPDRMSSPNYWTSSLDSGGVHSNSGVNNKAVALMVDGGTFNGFNVTGIGINKAAAIYYRAQTQHLTSGSDYADLYLALNQACRNLIGTDGISGSDCNQVAAALDAVEMNQSPAMDAGNDASLCGAGEVPSSTLLDNFENPANAQWASLPANSPAPWLLTIDYATSGTLSFSSTGSSNVSDQSLTLSSAVVVPPDGRLHFRHAFDLENGFDGGVLEYSTNGGTTWLDAGTLYSAGKSYGAAMGAGSPIVGRQAFTGSSHGYVSTRYDLGSLAGQSVRLRFRNTSDASIPSWAWLVDDVRIYRCVADSSANQPPSAHAGEDVTVPVFQQVTLDPSSSVDTDGEITRADWTQISGPVVTTQGLGWSRSFGAPVTATQVSLVFRLTVRDDRGATSTDDIMINVVNKQPISHAGADQSIKPRAFVSLTGNAIDPDGSIFQQGWSQVGGPIVALSSSNSTTITFNAPSVASSALLTFRYTATDQLMGTGSDDVSVLVSNDQPTAGAGPDTTVAAGASVTLSGSASDPDGSITTYQWQQLSGPFPTNFSNPNLASVSFTAPSLPDPSTLVFRLTATDNDGAVAVDDVSVRVNVTPENGGGGGGALSYWLLASLFGLATARLGIRSRR